MRFLVRVPGGTVYFTPSELVISMSGVAEKSAAGEAGNGVPGNSGQSEEADRERHAAQRALAEARGRASQHVVRMNFIDAQPAEVRGGAELPSKVNYLLGNDPSKWHRNVSTHDSIEYIGLYPGTTLKYENIAGRMKGTYMVAAGTSPDSIKWRYEGAQSVSVDAEGNLQILAAPLSSSAEQAPEGIASSTTVTITEEAPIAWQDIEGQRVSVSAHYEVDAEGHVKFGLGSFDQAYPLTIDPYITFSTYLGGFGSDLGRGVAVDGNSNIYVAGVTDALNFPLRGAYSGASSGGRDAFITKYNSTGTVLLYSTYLGASLDDVGTGVAVDATANIYISGYTNSPDFPRANAYQPALKGDYDAFVAKLDSDGASLVYSTYLGGVLTDIGADLAVMPTGEVCITGVTDSLDFPSLAAAQPAKSGGEDAFVTKLEASGAGLVYSTYLGGAGEEGFSYSFESRPHMGVALDSGGNAYVSGTTSSTNFTTTVGALRTTYGGGDYDAFVTKVNATGSSFAYSTYLGGSLTDYGGGIAVDTSGSAYITGGTFSTDFPVSPGAAQPANAEGPDVFVTKLNPTGSAPVYSTYLGETVIRREAPGTGATMLAKT